MRNIDPPDAGFPGIRYVLLHSFAHAFIRQLALSSGYTAASIRERIYSRDPGPQGEPMAGVLLYTAAPDSEGTLGGLVSLDQTDALGTRLDAALEQVRLCVSDPLCAEHAPHRRPYYTVPPVTPASSHPKPPASAATNTSTVASWSILLLA
jgi:hypothetical protein